MYKLVLIRHGESTWNKENRFTGWTDVPLSEKGIEEARRAGNILRERNFSFDLAFSSILIRANDTLIYTLEAMNHPQIPIERSWKLNERHYGSLQGLNKAEMAEKYGEEQVKMWRRSFATRPPELSTDDPRFPGNDPLYKDLPKEIIPKSEALSDTVVRVFEYWNENIAPKIKEGKKVLIVAHGNSLRALIKFLDDVPEKDIVELNIPTGMPLVYELDDNLKPTKHYYLASEEEIQKAVDLVKSQGKA